MKTLTARYAAWCRRQGTMQCSPPVIGFALIVIAGWMIVAGIDHELTIHRTGFMQAVAGTGAVLACLAAAALVIGAMKIVEHAPALATPVISPEPGRQPAIITAMTLRPEERADMEAEADLLADAGTTLAVSGNGAVYGLQDEPEDAS